MRYLAVAADRGFERLHLRTKNEILSGKDLVDFRAERFREAAILLAQVEQRHAHRAPSMAASIPPSIGTLSRGPRSLTTARD